VRKTPGRGKARFIEADGIIAKAQQARSLHSPSKRRSDTRHSIQVLTNIDPTGSVFCNLLSTAAITPHWRANSADVRGPSASWSVDAEFRRQLRDLQRNGSAEDETSHFSTDAPSGSKRPFRHHVPHPIETLCEGGPDGPTCSRPRKFGVSDDERYTRQQSKSTSRGPPSGLPKQKHATQVSIRHLLQRASRDGCSTGTYAPRGKARAMDGITGDDDTCGRCLAGSRLD
jgi:hypothetical protein